MLFCGPSNNVNYTFIYKNKITNKLFLKYLLKSISILFDYFSFKQYILIYTFVLPTYYNYLLIIDYVLNLNILRY